jgi:hypothetical protein
VTLHHGIYINFHSPYVLSKGVTADDTKCFDDYGHPQKFVKGNEKNPEFSFFLSHEKWTKYFSKGNNAANHPELLKLVQFYFTVPAHNGNTERVVHGQKTGTDCPLT